MLKLSEALDRLARYYLDETRATCDEQRFELLDADWPQVKARLEYMANRISEKAIGFFSDFVLALNTYWDIKGMAQDQITCPNKQQRHANLHIVT